MTVARCLIREFQNGSKALAQEGFEDLLQECLAHWLFKKEEFDPVREVTLKTFMNRVIKNHLLNILEKKSTQKRQVQMKSVSLNDFLEENEGPTIEKFFGVESETRRMMADQDLSEALRKAFLKMSARQKELCRLLGEEGLSVSEASKGMSVPRSTLQEEIKRIREVFRKEGLENYLK